MSERIVPPPLPSANPVPASMPPPLPASSTPGGAKPPPLPGNSTTPGMLGIAPQSSAIDTGTPPAVEQATTDDLFAFPPVAEPVAKAQTEAADPLPGPSALADSSPARPEAKSSQARPSGRGALIVGGVVVVASVAVVAYFLFGNGQSSVVPAKPAAVAEPVQKAAPEAPPAPKSIKLSESQPEPVVEVAPAPEERPSPKVVVPAPRAKTDEPAAKRLEHLEGAFYLFGNSIKKTSRGYRMAYAVLNSDIAPGNELSGKVKSQVFRVLVNCQNSTWGYDQRYYHARQFGEGDRLDERVWVISEVKFKPIRDSVQDKRIYELMCR